MASMPTGRQRITQPGKSGSGITTNLNYRHTFGAGIFQNFTATFNRNTGLSTPFFANGADIAATLGIQGASSNPINFGPPTVSFTVYFPGAAGTPWPASPGSCRDCSSRG